MVHSLLVMVQGFICILFVFIFYMLCIYLIPRIICATIEVEHDGEFWSAGRQKRMTVARASRKMSENATPLVKSLFPRAFKSNQKKRNHWPWGPQQLPGSWSDVRSWSYIPFKARSTPGRRTLLQGKTTLMRGFRAYPSTIKTSKVLTYSLGILTRLVQSPLLTTSRIKTLSVSIQEQGK